MHDSSPIHFRRPDGRRWDIERDVRINRAFSDALWSEGEKKRARALRECSRDIIVDTLRLPDGTEFEQLVSRHACRQRACLLCSRVAAWKRRRKLHQVLAEYHRKPQRTHPIFIVLTRPAVHYTDLRNEFAAANAALRKFLRAKPFQNAFGSFARTLEFNFNAERGTCNCHYNILAMAVPDYFENREVYLDQRRDLVPLWGRCCGTTNKRICWIEDIHHDDEEGQKSAVFETCKYITKQYAFVARDQYGNISVDPHPFTTITRAMHGVRFFALGGLFRDLHARIAQRDADAEPVGLAAQLGAKPLRTTRWRWSSRKQRFVRSAFTS